MPALSRLTAIRSMSPRLIAIACAARKNSDNDQYGDQRQMMGAQQLVTEPGYMARVR